MSGVLSVISTALYSKLSGDSTLTALLSSSTAIYAIKAPINEEYPFITYSLQYGGPVNDSPSDLQEHLYFIRAYAINALAAGNIHARITALLHHGTISVAGYNQVWISLDEEYENEETDAAGKTVFTRGGSFRIVLDN